MRGSPSAQRRSESPGAPLLPGATSEESGTAVAPPGMQPPLLQAPLMTEPAPPSPPESNPESKTPLSEPPSPQLRPPDRLRSLFLGLGAIFIVSFLWWSQGPGTPPGQELDYSEFRELVEENQVESVVLQGASVRGQLRSAQSAPQGASKSFRTTRPPDDASLLPLLLEKGVRIGAESDQPSLFVQILAGALPWILIIGLSLWLSGRAKKAFSGEGGPFSGILKNKSRKFDQAAAVNVTLADVAGLGSAKRDLAEVVQFLKEPVASRRLGAKVPRGILLIGPPGTGKTLLARAIAGESGVPFFSISASEFIELFVGVGASRVRNLFAESKKAGPAIIFIDEIDAIGRSRGTGVGGGHDEREQTLNQLLSEMDGFDRNDLTIVMAATNRPDVLDPALLRPGRFDRRIMVGRPELRARREILGVHIQGKPLHADVDLDAVANSTPGFSGADLANLVNEAALHATARSAEAIQNSDFDEARDKIILGDPSEAILSDAERRRVAVHESGHALVAHFSDSEPLHRVTILPRGMALGSTQQSSREDRHILTEPELKARLRVLMGGYSAERLVLDCVSTGAEDDLKQATKLATKMVAHYGMSSRLGAVYYEHDAEHPFLGQRMASSSAASDETTHTIESEARGLLATSLADASDLLQSHRSQLDALVSLLIRQETIEKGELQRLLGAPLIPSYGEKPPPIVDASTSN